MGIFKKLTSAYGGLLKEFDYDERSHFEGIEDERGFFTDQERQSIIKYMLYNIRADESDLVGDIHFLHGQLMCEYHSGLYAGSNYCQSHVLVDTLMLTVKLVYKLKNCA